MTEIRENEDGKELEKTIFSPRSSIRATEWRLATSGSNILVVIQLSSCIQLWDPMDCSTLGFPVLHHLPESVQTHVHWVDDAIQPSYPLLLPLSSCPQPFPESGSVPMNPLFTLGGQSIGALASASVLPVNIQDWFPLALTGLTSFLSKGLSRVFSSITVQKHQLFSPQPSLWANSHICTWLLEII